MSDNLKSREWLIWEMAKGIASAEGKILADSTYKTADAGREYTLKLVNDIVRVVDGKSHL